jgi:hypothetical protein
MLPLLHPIVMSLRSWLTEGLSEGWVGRWERVPSVIYESKRISGRSKKPRKVGVWLREWFSVSRAWWIANACYILLEFY